MGLSTTIIPCPFHHGIWKQITWSFDFIGLQTEEISLMVILARISPMPDLNE
jgi:hypothetical protein